MAARDHEPLSSRVVRLRKRLVAAIATLANKYRYDVFYRTEVNIVGLQVLFGVVILIIAGVGAVAFYNNVSESLTRGIREALPFLASPETGETIIADINAIKTQSIIILAGVIIAVTTFFGYLIARVTLTPARNSLSAQKQFIGNIAHELRTPLSIIKTNIEVAMLDGDLDRRLLNTLESNIEELDRISDIINNLLSFNAFVRPEHIEFKNVDLGGVVDTVVKKLSRLAEHKQLAVSVRKGNFRIVHGNATALEQIVMNILKNAIGYTPEHGYIRITVEPNYRDFIELTIEDSGMGIARQDLFRIFEPFYRAERSRARRLGGSGLGLAIVNELVKLHRGKIIIKSAPQKGTTVVASFPCGSQESKDEDGSGKNRDEIAIDFSKRNA